MGRRVCRLEGWEKKEKKGRVQEWTDGEDRKGAKGGVCGLKEK
jgi:hypothetical protein